MKSKKNPLAPPAHVASFGEIAIQEWERVAPLLYKRNPDWFPLATIQLSGYCVLYRIYCVMVDECGSEIPDDAKVELRRQQHELALCCEKLGMPWDDEGRMIVDESVVFFDKYKGKTDLEGLDEILGWAENDFRGDWNKIARAEWNRIIPELVERGTLDGRTVSDLNELIRYCDYYQQCQNSTALLSLIDQCNIDLPELSEMPFNHFEFLIECMQQICAGLQVPCDARGVMIFSDQVVSIDATRNRDD